MQAEAKAVQTEALIFRLRMQSSVPSHRDEVFNDHVKWPISDVEHFLASVGPSAGDVSAQDVRTLRSCRNEAQLQQRWFEILRMLDSEVQDTHQSHKSGGQPRFALKDAFGTHHFPDITRAVGPSVVWENVLWMMELKFDLTPAELRDAVVQLYVRLLEVLERQPDRAFCVGAVCDKETVAFVRAERKERRLLVSDRLSLFDERDEWTQHGQLLLRFAGLGKKPEAGGFVPAVLPVILDLQTTTRLSGRNQRGVEVWGSAEAVVKCGPEPVVAHEARLLEKLGACRPQVAVRLLKQGSGCFSMEVCDDLQEAVEGLVVEEVAGQLFWHLFQLHEAGIVHGDVKPGNVLLLKSSGSAVLCDFEGAVEWRDGDAPPSRLCTKGFDHDAALVNATPRDWDVEGLLWTVVYLLARQCAISEDTRLSSRDWMSNRVSQLVKFIDNPVVVRLCVVVGNCKWNLVHPRSVVEQYPARNDLTLEAWTANVRALEKEKRWFRCPDEILRRVFEQR
jgi:hypothetical protein